MKCKHRTIADNDDTFSHAENRLDGSVNRFRRRWGWRSSSIEHVIVVCLSLRQDFGRKLQKSIVNGDVDFLSV